MQTSSHGSAPSVGGHVVGARRKPKAEDIVASGRPPTTKGPINYFLRRPTDNVIQIGQSEDFKKRLNDHQRDGRRAGYQWNVLAVVHGDKTSEDALKRHFAEFALKGETEWFHPAVSWYRYIRWLRDQPFVATCAADSDIETTTADRWLPMPGRETLPPYGLFSDEFLLLPRVLTGDDYYTPTELIDAVRIGMGDIDLDPASHPVANQRHGIPNIFTATTNGLAREWYGRVWLNPPFAEWRDWAETAVRELKSGRVTQMTALMTTAAITSHYMQPLLRRASLRLTSRGRFEFWGKLVDEGNGCGASTGHELIYVGPRCAEMAKALSGIGTIWTPYPDVTARNGGGR